MNFQKHLTNLRERGLWSLVVREDLPKDETPALVHVEMANNRMWLFCNECVPPGTEHWPCFDSGKMFHLAKWYPAMAENELGPFPSTDGAYYTNVRDEVEYVRRLDEFFRQHQHRELNDGRGLENPVRLEYETWVRDMPAIKKWEYKS